MESDVSASIPPEKSWMRPWELAEIRENAPKWNLAADAGLLKYLEAFKMRFMEKAQESTHGINSLMHDTNMTDVKVRNVTDRFMTLNDSQFIENRVYDEDISADVIEDTADKDSEAKVEEIDPFPKLKTAIQLGLKVLEESFDVLDPNAANSDFDSDIDSDDDERVNGMAEQKLYEPIDIYVTRPLPHLIGSRGFHEFDDVGVRDLPSDDELARDDQGSISESDEDVEKLSLRKDSISSTESDVSDVISDTSDLSDEEKPLSHVATQFMSSSEDSELFSDSDRENDEPKHSVSSKTEAAGKLSHKERTKSQPAKSDLFGSEDEGNDLFEDSGGLFGNAPNLFDKKKKGDGLFDDTDISDENSHQDSEDDFSDNSTKLSSEHETDTREERASSKNSSKPLGGIALFGGALNKELLSRTRKESSTSHSDSVSQASERSSTKKTSNLFDADESEEDDLFSTKPKSNAVKSIISESNEEKPPSSSRKELKKELPKTKPSSELFADDENDMIFGDAPLKHTEKNAAPNRTVSKKVPVKSVVKKKPDIFDSDSSDNDSMFSKKPPPMKPKSSQASKAKDLFDSDSDDYFSSVVPKPSAKTSKAESAIKPDVLDKFSLTDSEDDMFTAPKAGMKKLVGDTVKISKASDAIFSESDQDDVEASIIHGSGRRKNTNGAETVQATTDLFGHDSEEEEQASPPIKKKPPGAISMFGGGFAGGELTAAILKKRAPSATSTESSSNASEADKGKDEVLHRKEDMVLPASSAPRKAAPLNFTAKPFGSAPSTKPSTAKSPNSKLSVGDLRSSLSINPTSLLPGAAPKQKPVAKVEISFDKPPDVKTLENVNKTRARGQKNRRPPSRHARGQAPSKPTEVEDQPSFEQNLGSIKSDDTLGKSTGTNQIDFQEPIAENVTHSKESIFDEVMPKAEPPKSLLESSELDEELFSGSLFSKTSKNDKKDRGLKLLDDDLFGDDDNVDDFLKDLPKSTPSATKAVKDFDEDIFGDLPDDVSTWRENIEKDGKAKQDESTDVGKFTTDIDLFDDEDIFGEKATDKKLAKNSEIDDVDIFKSMPTERDTNAKTGKSILSPDDNIFGSDIFSSGASSKKTGKANKKSKSAKTATGSSIFDDQDELNDIFATSSAKKKKTSKSASSKKSSQSKASKPTSSAVEDDPLSMP